MNLIIGNTFTKAYGNDPSIDVNATAEIYDCLSYVVPNHELIAKKMHEKDPEHYDGTWDGVKSFYNRRNGLFLTGFLDKVTDRLMNRGLPFMLTDRRSKPHVAPEGGNYDLEGIELRDYQTRARKDFLSHKICGLSMPRGVIHAATGAGKTEIAASVIRGLNVPTMFMTHRTHLLRQTAARFAKRMPELSQRIGIVGDSDYSPNFITCATEGITWNNY